MPTDCTNGNLANYRKKEIPDKYKLSGIGKFIYQII